MKKRLLIGPSLLKLLYLTRALFATTKMRFKESSLRPVLGEGTRGSWRWSNRLHPVGGWAGPSTRPVSPQPVSRL